jgi:hypothetical protein
VAQSDTDDLPARGAPSGRVGGATRGDGTADGALALDLVAPAKGTGVTMDPVPTLFYVASGPVALPVRFTVVLSSQAKPLVDVAIPAPAGRGMFRLATADFALKLEPERTYVWSVAVIRDPEAPSRDLVVSAPLQRRLAPTTIVQALRDTPPEGRPGLLSRAGYWYDAVASAIGLGTPDGQAAIDIMLRGEGLDAYAGTRPG